MFSVQKRAVLRDKVYDFCKREIFLQCITAERVAMVSKSARNAKNRIVSASKILFALNFYAHRHFFGVYCFT